MLQWEVKKRKSNTPKLSTINHVQDPVQMFFFNILDVYFKYCTISKSQNFTIFKKSMTTIITFQVKILPNVRVARSKYNFLSRNLGHKELINKTSITFWLFSWQNIKNTIVLLNIN